MPGRVKKIITFGEFWSGIYRTRKSSLGLKRKSEAEKIKQWRQ